MSRRAVGVRVATVLALCAAACGGASSTPPAPTSDDGGMASSAAASDAALRPGVAFVQGSTQCCMTGLGRSCCTADEKELGRCGEFNRCIPAGGGIVGKIICQACCDGLVPMVPVRVVDGKCESAQFPGSNICAPCGDGVCNADVGENVCSCPADCQ